MTGSGLVELDVIEPMSEPTDLVSSMVVVFKPNGKIRLCIDSADPNKAVKREHFLLNTFENVVTQLNEAKIFVVLDASNGYSNGYWSVRLDEECAS